MKNIINMGFYYGTNVLRKKKINLVGKGKYFSCIKTYAGKRVLNSFETNSYIKDKILEKSPLCVGRFGATELFCSSMFEFDVKSKKEKALEQLVNWSGFFPKDKDLGDSFNQMIKESVRKVDLLGIWNLRYEDYYINKYTDESIRLSHLYNLEPWICYDNPWTAALRGKRVLIIHPFEDSIISQYKKRADIFPGTDILPEFELYTMKAVQTVAGAKDDRFETWFNALEWMFEEVKKVKFDVAIIGCGAYGLPLAAKIKKHGKQAIHLGGATQLLFGIKGKRWDEEQDKEYVRKYYNSEWAYPFESEKPQNAIIVEGGCYWK